MKIISIVNFILAFLLLGLTAYLHFVVADLASYWEAASNDDYTNKLALNLWIEATETRFNYGMIAMCGGALTFIIALITTIKLKNVLSFIALILSLVSLIVGAAYSTHIFS